MAQSKQVAGFVCDCLTEELADILPVRERSAVSATFHRLQPQPRIHTTVLSKAAPEGLFAATKHVSKWDALRHT